MAELTPENAGLKEYIARLHQLHSTQQEEQASVIHLQATSLQLQSELISTMKVRDYIGACFSVSIYFVSFSIFMYV